jgi:methyl-accepting chemotaxis protein
MSDRAGGDHRGTTTVTLRERWRSPRDTRRAGQLMIGLGVVGALVALFGMVVGWMFVGQLATASDDTLEVTLQSLDAIEDTLDLADDVLVSSVDGIDALAGALTAVSGSFDAGTAAIDDIAGLADTIGPSLGDAADTVRTLERIGGDIDAVLAALSNIPFGPDYEPTAGLGDTFGQLADTLEALPDQLASTSSNLTEFTGSAGDLQQQLDGLASSVTAISDDLADTPALIDQYRQSVADARALAVDANDDLDTGVVLMRILLVVGGLTLLLGQVVPLWLGRSLLDAADAADAADRACGARGDDGPDTSSPGVG